MPNHDAGWPTKNSSILCGAAVDGHFVRFLEASEGKSLIRILTGARVECQAMKRMVWRAFFSKVVALSIAPFGNRITPTMSYNWAQKLSSHALPRRAMAAMFASRRLRREDALESHITLAHTLWRSMIAEQDTCVDATCGRGHDTFELLRLVGKKGRVVAMDQDPEAIEYCRGRADLSFVEFWVQSHEYPPPNITSAKLVVFNLGYLPGRAKRTPTQAATTLAALTDWVLPTLEEGGCASITVYPGHPEGGREARALAAFVRELPDSAFRATEHIAVNHKASAPYLLTIYKLRHSPSSHASLRAAADAAVCATGEHSRDRKARKGGNAV